MCDQWPGAFGRLPGSGNPLSAKRRAHTEASGPRLCPFLHGLERVHTLLLRLFSVQDNPNIKVDEQADALEERTEQPADGAEVRVWGNVVAFVERLDDELFKSLQVGLARMESVAGEDCASNRFCKGIFGERRRRCLDGAGWRRQYWSCTCL